MIGMSALGAVSVLTDSMKKGTRYLDAQIPGSETVQQFEERIIEFIGVRIMAREISREKK